jgi:hypothetical protein
MKGDLVALLVHTMHERGDHRSPQGLLQQAALRLAPALFLRLRRLVEAFDLGVGA